MLSERLQRFVEPIMAMCRSQFPRTCGTCHHRFQVFGEWVRQTDPLDAPTLDDEMMADPFGMLSWVNCRCGSTLMLECEQMQAVLHHQFLQALNEESALCGRRVRDLLQDLRDEIRQRAVADRWIGT